MLFLLLKVKDANYAVSAREVIEVVPRVDLLALPKAPAFVAGLLNYRGDAVPVLDLCVLMHGAPCAAVFGSRIVLVHYRHSQQTPRVLGLIVARVTETLERTPEEFHSSAISGEATPYLADVTPYRDGLAQRIDVERLLPTEVHNMLFQ